MGQRNRFAFRSTSMGAPEWFLDAPNGGNDTEPWTRQERDALKACVDTYKTRIRPLVRKADLYHVFGRPDDRGRDGIEFYNPATGKGVVYLFQPSAAAPPQQASHTTTETAQSSFCFSTITPMSISVILSPLNMW